MWRGRIAPEDGDYCIAEVPFEGPAHLVEVLGADDRPEWDDHAVASQFRLRERFPAACLEEADSFREPGATERQGRLDLRDLPVVAIDPADARDHDDALSLRELSAGRWEVGVHIADVSWYVRPGSALDAEARARGTSCYLPGGVVPMLPERLSADLCSLREGRDRLALSVLAVLDDRGLLHEYRFAETVVRSAATITYEQVQAALEGGPALPGGLQGMVERLMALARALRRHRFAVGALAIESPEVKPVLDENGHTLRLERRPHLESHELIEEFMLLANRCVGEAGSVREAGLLWRVHDLPAGPKLAQLDETLRALGLPRLGRLDEPHRALQALLDVKLDPARRRLVHRLALRSLARARYLERDTGHFGLATREYCHFTSPIRRYPDLHNHRRVREWIEKRPDGAWDPHERAVLSDECTAREQDATDAEREAVKVRGLRVLETRLGEVASGSISALTPRGFFVELDDDPLEGFVRVSDESDERFDLDAAGVRLIGRRSRRRFTLGDSIRVIVARVDVPARECDLALEPTDRRRGRRTHGRHGWQ